MLFEIIVSCSLSGIKENLATFFINHPLEKFDIRFITATETEEAMQYTIFYTIR